MDDYNIDILGKDIGESSKLIFVNNDGGSPSKRIKTIEAFSVGVSYLKFTKRNYSIYYEFQVKNNDKNKVVSITEGGNIVCF